MNARTEEDKIAADDTDIEVENEQDTRSEIGTFIQISEDTNHLRNGASQNGENNNNNLHQQE